MTKQAERDAALLAFALLDHRRAQEAELAELRRVRDVLKFELEREYGQDDDNAA